MVAKAVPGEDEARLAWVGVNEGVAPGKPFAIIETGGATLPRPFGGRLRIIAAPQHKPGNEPHAIETIVRLSVERSRGKAASRDVDTEGAGILV